MDELGPCGTVAWHRAATLLFAQAHSKASATRAPGPGAIREVEWKPLAHKHLQDRHIVPHTGKAKS